MAIDSSTSLTTSTIMCKNSLLRDNSSHHFGSEGSQHLDHPSGICIDYTNTVYVTDSNYRISVYTSSGQFVKSFGVQKSGGKEVSLLPGIAVDNTTGALYVCDYYNNRVVVY